MHFWHLPSVEIFTIREFVDIFIIKSFAFYKSTKSTILVNHRYVQTIENYHYVLDGFLQLNIPNLYARNS